MRQDVNKVYADWSPVLICKCPHCNEYVDLVSHPNFWENCNDWILIGRPREDLEVVCPLCSSKFEVDVR